MLRRLGLVFVFSLTVLGNLRTAQADVPPLDICYDEGAECSNLGTGGKGGGSGTCQKAKCQRAAPPGEAGAAGDGVIVYDCLRCLRGGGSGGSPASGGSGGSAGSTQPPQGGSGGELVTQGGSAGSEPVAGEGGVTGVAPGGCDCRIGSYRHEHALALLMLTGGLYLVRRSRRGRNLG